VRSENLKLVEADKKEIQLDAGTFADLIWHAQIVSADTPWVSIVIPDEMLSARKELSGIAASK
jgi:hypothetical protein